MPTQITFPPDDSFEGPGPHRHYWDRFLPVPPNGKRCPVSGLGHAKFYRKVIDGPGKLEVRILDLKEPGEKRSTKYYHAGDLYRWLDRLARERHGGESKAGNQKTAADGATNKPNQARDASRKRRKKRPGGNGEDNRTDS